MINTRTSLESQLETDIILAEPPVIQLYEEMFPSPRETLNAYHLASMSMLTVQRLLTFWLMSTSPRQTWITHNGYRLPAFDAHLACAFDLHFRNTHGQPLDEGTVSCVIPTIRAWSRPRQSRYMDCTGLVHRLKYSSNDALQSLYRSTARDGPIWTPIVKEMFRIFLLKRTSALRNRD